MAYKVPDSFVPDIAQEAIVEGIAGAIVLYGSPAAIVRNDLVVNGAMRDGDEISIEYYGMIPPYQRNVPQAVGLAPEKGTNTREKAPAYQHGLRVDWSKWYECLDRGKATGKDPYQLFAGMFVQQFVHLAEDILIETARTGLDAAYIHDVSGASKKMGWDEIADTKLKFGDEGDQIALMSVHSVVKNNLTKERDSMNRPLYLDPMNGGSDIPRIQGVAVKVSDKNYVSAGTYDSLYLQPGAVAMRHSTPTAEPFRDPISNVEGLVSWVWTGAIRYAKLPGKTRPGVGICRSKG
jgi:hypothetical protein